MGWSPGCYILSFAEIGPPVLEKKIFEGFYHIWAFGHLGHVTSIMSSDFHFLVPETFHTKCVWFTELTCISNGVSKTDIVVGKVQCVCVCVDRWRGHSRCRAPLTTGVDIYPKVLPSAYCVLLAGPLPLQGALNHWGRYLPQGPTICILCASGGATPFAGRP